MDFELDSFIKDAMDKGEPLDIDFFNFCKENQRLYRVYDGLIRTIKILLEKGFICYNSDILYEFTQRQTETIHYSKKVLGQSIPVTIPPPIYEEIQLMYRSLRLSLSRCHELNRTGKVKFLPHAEQSNFSECLVGKSEQYKNFAFTLFPELMVEDGIREEWIMWFRGHLFPEVEGGAILGYPDCLECGDATNVTHHNDELNTYWCGCCDHEMSESGECYTDMCGTCDTCNSCGDISGVDENGWCDDCEVDGWNHQLGLEEIRQKKLDEWDSDKLRLSVLPKILKYSDLTLSQLIEHEDEFFNQLKDRFVEEEYEFYFDDDDGGGYYDSYDMPPFVHISLPDSGDDDYDLAEELGDASDPFDGSIYEILVPIFLEEPGDNEGKMRFAEIMANKDCRWSSEFIDLICKSGWGDNLSKPQRDLLG